MNTVSSIYVKQTRLAQHYLDKLRSARRVYSRGNDHAVYGLKLAEQDWLQIQQWQSWAASHAAHQRDAAELCVAYPQAAGDLLNLMLTAQEHRVWCETALSETRRLGDHRAELAHLLALGEVCWRLSEFAQTDVYIQQALELAGQDQQSRAHGLRVMGQAAFSRSQYAEAETLFEQSLEICRRLDNQVGIARNLIGLVSIMERRGEYSDVIQAYAEESLTIFQHLGDHRGTAQALSALAKSLKNDDPEQALSCLEQGLELLQRVGNLTDVIELYITLGNTLALMSQYQRAKTISEEALRIFRQQGSRHGVMTSLRFLGSLELSAGQFAAARTYAEQSLEIARELNSLWDVGVNLMNLGTISTILDRYERAYDDLVLAEEVLRRVEAPIDLAYTLVLLAFNHWSRGETEKVHQCLGEVFFILHEHSYPLALMLAVTAAGALHLMIGDPQKCVLLLGVVDVHPQTTLPVRRFGVGKVRRAAEQVLDAETVARLMEEGGKRDFEATVAEIRAELAAP